MPLPLAPVDMPTAFAYHARSMSQDASSWSAETVVVAAAGPVACEVDGAFVILEPEAGCYFGTERVGAFVWRLLEAPISVGAICRQVVDAFEVAPAQCEADVHAFLRELHVHRLIDVRGEPAAS